jgi:hypothetical protein
LGASIGARDSIINCLPTTGAGVFLTRDLGVVVLRDLDFFVVLALERDLGTFIVSLFFFFLLQRQTSVQHILHNPIGAEPINEFKFDMSIFINEDKIF